MNASYCLITIRRPNGNVEVVNYTEATSGKVRCLAGSGLKAFSEQMKKAGRGEVLSVENVKTKECANPTEAELKSDREYAEYKRGHDAVANMAACGERWS